MTPAAPTALQPPSCQSSSSMGGDPLHSLEAGACLGRSRVLLSSLSPCRNFLGTGLLTTVNHWKPMQTELRIMGSAIRLKKAHSAIELAACKTKAHACRIALLHSGLTQETVADRLSVTAGYLSMLLSGKRKWQDDLQHRFIHITGSLAPLQWDALREGVEVYVDSKRVREAELLAELAELRAA